MKSQRRWTRFPSDEPNVTIQTRGAMPKSGEVLDESFGGISVLLKDISELQAGMEVEVGYGSVPIGAFVRYVVPEMAEKYRVGLLWRYPPASRWGAS